MTPKPPGLLVRYLKQSRCVVFVGAGLSAGAGLPTWKALLREVINELVSSMPEGDTHQTELMALVDQGKLLEVADFCKEQLGAAYHQFLTERLRGDGGVIPQTHEVLMHLPFSAWVTTNYDKLLERAFFDVKKVFPKTLTHKDTDTLGRLLFDAGPFILKAHGDIDRPETVVLTSRDYSEIIHANPAFNEIFTGLLLTKALFFVGYSLSDPDFRLLMDRQLTHFRGFVPERFALMTDLGPVERDVLWRTARIQVIPYVNDSKKHAEVLEFLQALKAAVQPGPAAAAASKPVATSAPTSPHPQPQPAQLSSRNTSSPTQPPLVFSSPYPAPTGAAQPAVTDTAPLKASPGARPVLESASPIPPQQGPASGSGLFTRLINSVTETFLPTAEEEPELGTMILDDEPPPPASAPPGSHNSSADEAEQTRAPPPARSPAPAGAPAPARVSAHAASAQARRLFIEAVQGRLQLRLTDAASTPLAQCLAPEALNAELFPLLRREWKDAQLHAGLYTELTQLFARHLPAEMLTMLGTSVTTRHASLDLRVAPDLAHFPWELLPAGDKPLSYVHKVVRTPVGVAAQARGRPSVRVLPSILFVEGQRNRGESEAPKLAHLAQVYQSMPEASCRVLVGEEATFDRVTAELDRALPDLLHFSGDVGLADGELYLDLPGQVELSMGALRSALNRGQLPFLVVSAPSSAFAPYAFGVHPVQDGYQRLVMPKSQGAVFDGRAAFMELATQAGVGAFVGTFDMPGAQMSSAFTSALHRALVLRMPVAEAFRHAIREVHSQLPGDPTVFSYVLSGDGGLQLRKEGADEE